MSAPQPPCGHLHIPADDQVAIWLGLGAVALRYISLGLPVLPLKPGRKEPDCEHGFLDATTDPEVIRRWWTENRLRGIGLRMGLGRATVDLDRKNGPDGVASFGAWLAELGLALPWAPWAETPTNGIHVQWRLPPGRTMTSRSGVLPGVDIRADGGYVAAWPSRVAQRSLPSYERKHGEVYFSTYTPHGCWCQAPEMPPDLFDALASLPGTSAGGGGGGAGRGGGHDGQVAATVLSNVLRGMTEQECYQAWLEVAIPQNPSWPFTRADFRQRHYRTALDKAAKIRAADRQAYAAWTARGGAR